VKKTTLVYNTAELKKKEEEFFAQVLHFCKKIQDNDSSEEKQRHTSLRNVLIIPLSKSVINLEGFSFNFNVKAAFFNALKTRVYVLECLSLRRIQATGCATIKHIYSNRATNHSIK
jgi:hypothetical protein